MMLFLFLYVASVSFFWRGKVTKTALLAVNVDYRTPRAQRTPSVKVCAEKAAF